MSTNGGETKKYGLGDVGLQYSQSLDDWLNARVDRDGYLVAAKASDPRLRRVDQLTHQLISWLPDRAKVVDLGFGPEGRDMADVLTLQNGRKIHVAGVELVDANIRSALKSPQGHLFRGGLIKADLTWGIPLDDNSVDAAILSSVIQHIPHDIFYQKVIPEIRRVIKPGGVLQIVFKSTDSDNPVLTIKDETMGGNERSFYVYRPEEVVAQFHANGMQLYPGDEQNIGGILLWNDQKRGIPTAGMYITKK